MNKREKTINITGKLIIFSLALIIIPIGVLGILLSGYISDKIQENTSITMKNFANERKILLDETIEGAKREALVVSQYITAIEMLKNIKESNNINYIDEQRSKVNSFLKTIREGSNGLYENITFIDDTGIIAVT